MKSLEKRKIREEIIIDFIKKEVQKNRFSIYISLLLNEKGYKTPSHGIKWESSTVRYYMKKHNLNL